MSISAIQTDERVKNISFTEDTISVDLIYDRMSLPTQLPIDTAPLGYCTQSIDTKITADLLRFHLYHQRTTVERLILGAKYRQSARQLSFECLRQSFPELTNIPMFHLG